MQAKLRLKHRRDRTTDLGEFGNLTAELNYTHVIEYNQVVDGDLQLSGTHDRRRFPAIPAIKDRGVTRVGIEAYVGVGDGQLPATSDPFRPALNTWSRVYSWEEPLHTVPFHAQCDHTWLSAHGAYVRDTPAARYAVNDHLSLHGRSTTCPIATADRRARPTAAGGQLAYGWFVDAGRRGGPFLPVGATYSFNGQDR